MLIQEAKGEENRRLDQPQTEGWEVSARSWLAHAPVRWQSCPDEQEAARTDFCWLLQTNTRRAWPTFDRTQQEILVHPAWDTWLKVPAYCLLKMIWKRMQHLEALFFAVSHSRLYHFPLLHRLFILPLISVLPFEIKATKMENVFALCSQRNKQGAFNKGLWASKGKSNLLWDTKARAEILAGLL